MHKTTLKSATAIRSLSTIGFALGFAAAIALQTQADESTAAALTSEQEVKSGEAVD